MNERLGHSATGKLATAVAAAVGCVGLATERADAGLMIDLRAMTVNGQPLPAGSAADRVEVAPGDVVGINIVAVVSGMNALNDEAGNDIHGVFRSTTGGLIGDLGNSAVVAPYNASGSQNGLTIDIDSDGDLDVGPIPNGGATGMYWVARSAESQFNGTPIPGANPAAEEFLFGTMTFTAGASVTTGQETFLDFIRRRNPGNPGTNGSNFASWLEDGTGTASVRNGLSPYSVDGLAIVGVPEPSGVALAALTSLRLLARRRRRPWEG
jgi:hypothetical protein